MKYSCDVVKDLLPLYHDDVCSISSRKIVEEHLSECVACQSLMNRIDDDTYDDQLREEKKSIVGQYQKKVMRKSLTTGICFASILAVPILVCLIVNLAVGHALDWFFIVLTSLMVLASVTAVPLIIEKRKGLWTLGSFTSSLLLLLLTCCLYTGGNWFFVAAIPILFGLSVIFLPFIVRQLPLIGILARHKGLFVMSVDTLLLFAVIIASSLYGGHGLDFSYWRTAFLVTSTALLFPWGLFLIIRYLKASRLIRAGLSVVFGSTFLSLANSLFHFILEGAADRPFSGVNLAVWNSATTDANINLLIMLVGCVIGIVLLGVGMIRKGSGKKG